MPLSEIYYRDSSSDGLSAFEDFKQPRDSVRLKKYVAAGRTDFGRHVLDHDDPIAPLRGMQHGRLLVVAGTAGNRALHLPAPFVRTHPLRGLRIIHGDNDQGAGDAGTDDMKTPAHLCLTQDEATRTSPVVRVVLQDLGLAQGGKQVFDRDAVFTHLFCSMLANPKVSIAHTVLDVGDDGLMGGRSEHGMNLQHRAAG